MTRKTFKHDIPAAIKGMTFEQAKSYCLSEGFILSTGNKQNIDQTYLITVTEIDADGKILDAKYGY
jgi:hypothetical protein